MPDVDCSLEVTIDAPQEAVWDALTRETGQWFVLGEQPGPGLSLELEPFVGGRFFRNLSGTHGEGAGHLWGHVQVYKPSFLLEITGPLAVSAPAMNHVAFRLEPVEGGTRVRFTHRGTGEFPEDFAKGFEQGWTMLLTEGLKRYVERRHPSGV